MEREVFGRYELVERIDVGGMAEVFKAVQRGAAGFERVVAIKRILPSIAADPEIVRMFVEEAKLAVQLSHAGIAQVFDLGRVGDDYYIAMEHVDGASVLALLERHGARGARLPLGAVCHVLAQVADALHYAHSASDRAGRPLGIIHRDVSPANVLVSLAGDVKVIDFGLAKAENRVSQTGDGVVKGKLAYLSPEQAQGRSIDRRTDLFSLGVCAWEMLTGKRAFKRDDDRETVLAIRRGVIDPPSRYASVPAALERIVLRALAPDPDRRYGSALELGEDLEAFVREARLVFTKDDLASLMRATFPERFEDDEPAIELVREKRPRASDEDTLDDDVVPTDPVIELVLRDGGDTEPSILVPDHSERR